MRRSRFLSALAVGVMLLAGVVAAQVGASPAGATGPTIVYPTGSYPADVQNVQAAVDGGGMVVLKASNAQGKPTEFNFGPATLSGTGVNLTTDVSVQGETVGSHRTTIRGGFTPFFGSVPVHTRIADITFKSPLDEAILLTASSGTEIVDNSIDGVIGVHVRVSSGLIFTIGDGIDLFGDSDSIHGTATISGNVIRNLSSDFSIGIQLDQIAAVTALTNNVVDFPVSNGFVENDGIDALRVQTPLTMSGNAVHLGDGSPDSLPIGLFIAGDARARYRLTNNAITSEHPNAVGIMVRGNIPDDFGPTNEAVISSNLIKLASTTEDSSGILLLEGVNRSDIASNKLVGTADFGFAISWGVLPSPATRNLLVDNNLDKFTAGDVDFFLDDNTSHTTVEGQCRSFTDLGTDNRIVCLQHEFAPAPTGGKSRGLLNAQADETSRALARLHTR